jgi:hypothetical protein
LSGYYTEDDKRVKETSTEAKSDTKRKSFNLNLRDTIQDHSKAKHSLFQTQTDFRKKESPRVRSKKSVKSAGP